MNAKPEWMLQNESASVALLSLLYSPQDDNLIVAAAVAARSQQLLKALKAQMEKSGNNTLFAVELRSSERLMLRGAGRGYVYVSQPMIRANAVGYVACFLHKAACDPRLVVSPEGPFYVVLGQTAPVSQPFDIRDLFVERLQIISTMPVLPEWANFLISQGREAETISDLVAIDTCVDGFFARGLRLWNEDPKWANIIVTGLQSGAINFSQIYHQNPRSSAKICVQKNERNNNG